jgi:hypothetical protein
LNWLTVVTVDASPVGLAAVLTQENPNDKADQRVIIYISRMLNDTEKRYSQVEKEALAVIWACERLRLYLLGQRFKIYTDNRAVAIIFNNPHSKTSARLQRWQLRLVGFNFEILHKPGVDNISDCLSRWPVISAAEDEYEIDNINAIVGYAMPNRITREKMLQETLIDPILIQLAKMINSGKFNARIGHPSFAKIFNELTLSEEGLILRGDRLVVPQSLQQLIVEIAHEGHLGITKTKQLIRSKVWFPNIDVIVEKTIRPCVACQAVERSGSFIAPVKMSTMPASPWSELSIDFFGPIQPSNKYLLVIIDDYSRFPLVERIGSLKGIVVIERLEHLFSIFGIPEVIRSDNAPPFNGNEFNEFAKFMGFKLRLVTPLWPMANGLVESFMKNLKKVIQTAAVDGVHWRKRLIEFLRNYRSTPHMTTGVAPNTLLFRNASTSRLPNYKNDFQPSRINEYAV